MKTNHFSLAQCLLTAGFILFLTLGLNAQKSVDAQPEYPGGFPALVDFLSKNIKYPEAARKENAEGMVLVKFTVGADGALHGIKTVSEASQNPRADFVMEALRVIKMMPAWKPLVKNGKPVEAEMTLPIQFKLDQEKKP